jgi:predicted nucleic acid-binding Zn ribbon protein
MSDPELPDPDSTRPDSPRPDHTSPDGAEGPAATEPHDPSGLALARSVAQSLGAASRNRPRRSTRLRGQRTVGPGPQVSGAHPDDRDPQRLGAAVERLVESKGWATEVDLRGLLARWSSLVGSANAAHSHPEAFADTVLTVRTDSTAWATQLRLLAPQLVALLNEALGDGTVTRVQVRGPDGPSWKKGRLSVRDGRGPRDTYG